jgi:3-phosphoshikimate 1-carboxyvinyltransferase
VSTARTRVRVPGDKSVSHRALLLAALAEGESRLRGLLPGADCRSTAAALRALGVSIPELPEDGREIRIQGVGLAGLGTPAAPLDCGNSGTTARLLLGVLAGAGVEATLTGDASLRSRPMRRVTAPLSAMGAVFREEGDPDRLPVRVLARGDFRGGRYVLNVASAQVKSALLLAGVLAGVAVEVEEPGLSRDHTERMLRAMGVPVTSEQVPGPGGAVHARVSIPAGISRLAPLELDVPGDPSSAAFLLALAALGGAGPGLRVEGVGVNPTRVGFLPALRRMGVQVAVHARHGHDSKGSRAGEPVADLEAGPAALEATTIEGAEVPTLIDELPLLAALAARAEGVTRIRDAQELRVKESDRIRTVARNLQALGVTVVEHADGLDVTGRPGAALEGRVTADHDHRIAMAFGVLGALPGSAVEIDDRAVVEVSFPGFWALLDRVRGDAVGEEDAREADPSPVPPPAPRPPVVTLDGPAGSGKSTTARAVAERLGFLHLDSGALYRGVTLALLESGRPEEEWDQVTPAELDAFDVRLDRGAEGYRVLVGGEPAGSGCARPGSRNGSRAWRPFPRCGAGSWAHSAPRPAQAAWWPTAATWARWSSPRPR